MFQNPRGGGICSNPIKIISMTLLLLQYNMVTPTPLDDYVYPEFNQEDLESPNPNPRFKNGENRDYFGGYTYAMESMGGNGGRQLHGIDPQKALDSMEQHSNNSPARRDLFLRQLRRMNQYQLHKYDPTKPDGRRWTNAAYFRTMKKSIGALAKNRDRNG